MAWCHLREAVRTFVLDNLISAEILNEPASEVDSAELDALLENGYGIWSGKEVKWATLRFHPSSARWAPTG